MIGREKEIKELGRLYESDKSEMVVVYGRRRVMHEIRLSLPDVLFAFYGKKLLLSNKKAKRHPVIHGFKYSNKRIDTILLLSALYELLYLHPWMEPYYGAIIGKKSLKIDESKRNVITRKRKRIKL